MGLFARKPRPARSNQESHRGRARFGDRGVSNERFAEIAAGSYAAGAEMQRLLIERALPSDEKSVLGVPALVRLEQGETLLGHAMVTTSRFYWSSFGMDQPRSYQHGELDSTEVCEVDWDELDPGITNTSNPKVKFFGEDAQELYLRFCGTPTGQWQNDAQELSFVDELVLLIPEDSQLPGLLHAIATDELYDYLKRQGLSSEP
jgi:hypothetical protein